MFQTSSLCSFIPSFQRFKCHLNLRNSALISSIACISFGLYRLTQRVSLSNTSIFRNIDLKKLKTYQKEAFIQVNEKVKGIMSEVEKKKCRKKFKIGLSDHRDEEERPFLYIKSANEEKKVAHKVVAALGKGRSKQAYQLANGQVLMLPKTGISGEAWTRIVEEEVAFSKILEAVGLLGTQLRKVEVYGEENSSEPMPAYIGTSFAQFESQGIYIIDTKNSDYSRWKGPLFQTCAEAKILTNWFPLVDELANDIAKLIYYDLPYYGDSFNVAVEKTEEGHRIRYFGFDFTEIAGIASIPIIPAVRKIKSTDEKINLRAKSALSRAIQEILLIEYKTPYVLPKDGSELLSEVTKELLPLVLDKIGGIEKLAIV